MASAGEQVPPGAASAPDPGPPDDDRLKLLAGLSFKSDALSEKGKVHLRAFLDEVGIGSTTKVKEYTTDQLHVVDAWFDQAFDEPF